jgi:phosphopantothenoylcysteine decarboxylase
MILLGLTGSVATVLADKMIKALQKIDPEIVVIVTSRCKAFLPITPSGVTVYYDDHEWVWSHNSGPYVPSYVWLKDDPVLHITLRDRARALVIAPCSANTMAKIANGICDNLLTTIARAWIPERPLIIAPAMNTTMWNHPSTDRHISQINEDYERARIVQPQSKKLACGSEGMGAMANIGDIVSATEEHLRWVFPLILCEGIPTNPHPGAFGYPRRETRHTGVDMYCEDGAIVIAVEDGVIVGHELFTGAGDNSPWWEETWCVLIEGASGVVVYGELKQWNWKIGESVKQGCSIGEVKRVIKPGRERPDIPGHKPAMLHLELYPHGHRAASNGFEPFLMDPTQYLLKACAAPYKTYQYDGYKPK